ncbi:hypothetical protein WA026_022915 [Henosepilachna vigintioctopunctata]|uniref:Uncharacterized protein n=1 Tax=Henosepilachna vigintioctopunctata TaxID=420089 RepID=A0AAW1TT58_9CUCU
MSKLCLVYVMVFNRKRPGDCEKSRIVEWSNMASVSDEVIEKLSENDRQYALDFGRFVTQAEQCVRIFCLIKQFEFSKFEANMLRKHLATSTSTLPYERQRIVSDFMGHGMEIHNNIYKQRQVQVDCINIGEILFAFGDLHKKNSDSVPSAACSRTIEPQPGPSRETASNEQLFRKLIDEEGEN